MKLLRPHRRTIRPRLRSLIRFEREGSKCFIIANDYVLIRAGSFKSDEVGTLKCWRKLGAM